MTEPHALVADWCRRGRLAGAVVRTGNAAGQSQTSCHGWMRLEAHQTMRRDAIFRLASATKLLSSVAAMILVDRGLLQNLDDPVSKYLVNFKPEVLVNPTWARHAWRLVPAHRPVTLRDLLSHTSGLQYGFGINTLDGVYQDMGFPTWDRCLAEFVDQISSLPLAFQPGSQVSYGYGIDVLGHVMETVCKQPLDRLMRELLTEPLNMPDTAFFATPEKAARMVTYYEYCDGQLVPGEPTTRFLSPPAGLSAGGGWLTGYGGLVSTANDFGRVLAMLLAGGLVDGKPLLSASSVAEIFRDQTLMVPAGAGLRYPPALDFPGRGFGLGGAVQSNAATGLLHWGGAPYNTSFVVDRTLGVYGLFLAQTGPFEGEFVPDGIKATFRQAVRDAARA